MVQRLPVILAALVPAAPAVGGPQPAAYMHVALVAETLAPRPGSSVLVGLKMTPRPGWHGYWSNAGDSGLPPTVRWSAPSGVTFGALQHPAPTLLRVMGLTSYVHAGPHVLIARMAVNSAVSLGTPLPITANVDFAVCSDRLCVPQHVKLTMEMVTGDAKVSPDASLLRRALAHQPKALAPGLFDVGKGRLTLQLPATAHLDASRTRFFPDENGFFDASQARTLPTTPVRIVSPTTGDLPKALSGVVSDGSTAFRVRFRRGALAAKAPTQLPSSRLATKLEVASGPGAAPSVDDATRAHRNTIGRRGYAEQLSTMPATEWLIAVGGALSITLAALVWRRRRRRQALADAALKEY